MPNFHFDAPHALPHVFLVGGAVRDKLMGVDCHDRDFVVVGECVSKMKSLGFLAVGDDFPVFLHPSTREEYALARTERKTGKGYKGFEANAKQDVSLEDDLARRDLTVNSIAMSNTGEIVDPFNGQYDIQHKILRHTSEAFVEDPVRVLRIARFLARFGPQWTIHSSTQALMHKMHQQGELSHLVAERVWKETERALMEPFPHLFFETLVEFGLFPELANMRGVKQPIQHHPEGDVFVHTMLVVQRAADLNFDLATRFAALTHDFGKPLAFQSHGSLKGHEQLGIDIIDAFGERLRVPKKLTEIAKLMSDNHTHCHKIRELTPSELHTFFIRNMNALKQEKRFLQFLDACLCDAQGRGPSMVNKPYPQHEIATSYLACLKQLNAKKVIKDAMHLGKQGKALADALTHAQMQVIQEHHRTLLD